jgi:hypothetical protein
MAGDEPLPYWCGAGPKSDTLQVIRIEGWRATALLVALVAVGLLVAVVLTVALFWIGLAIAALVGVALLHVVYLPRAAAFVRRPVLELVLWLLPVAVLAGWGLAGESNGAIAGAALWAVLLVAPRLVAAYAARRLRGRARTWVGRVDPGHGTVVTLTPSTCPRCGQVAYGAVDRCAACGAETDQRSPLPLAGPARHQ